jgi:choline-sulfatase
VTAVGRATNVLFILTDDQGPWAMRCAGCDEIDTPNLDGLAETGTRFTNFFCASPVCSPARASLLTGRIPSQHGVHDWLRAGNTTQALEPEGTGRRIEYLQGIPGYTDALAAAGYRCALSGKWHLGDSHHRQKGYEFWSVHAKGGGPYYNAPMVEGDEIRTEHDYVTDAITDRAIEWLDRTACDPRPFYLGVHYTAPHSPWGREHHPTATWDRYRRECDFRSVPSGVSPPSWAKYLSIPIADENERRNALAGYFAAVTEMDRNVGRLLEALEARRLREHTLVVFTSDNGMNMGHHGVFGKGNATYPMNMYEESIRVPFIASLPGRISCGSVHDSLVSQYDFAPTLLDYLDVDPGPFAVPKATLPGRSFAPLFDDTRSMPPPSPADEVVIFDEYGPVRMIRTGRWKYVHRHGRGPDELYDLVEDPTETANLADDPTRRSRRNELRDRLVEWFARYVDPERDGASARVTGSGQLSMCGSAADGHEAFFAGPAAQFIDT